MATSFASRRRSARSDVCVRKFVVVVASAGGIVALAARCAGRVSPGSIGSIPDVSWRVDAERGSRAAEGAVSSLDNVAIAVAVVRDFFRPFGDQARWIDSRPLSRVRSDSADGAEEEDQDWSEAVVAAVGLERVCLAGR